MKKTIENFVCPKHGIIINTNIVKKEWKEKYDEIINFIIANRRFPRSRNCTEYEFNLNSFFTNEYDLYLENNFSNERKEFFEQIILISNEMKKEKWVEVIKDNIVFILCNSKFPSKGKDEFEKRPIEYQL